MSQLSLFYATNRRHEGERTNPTGYGTSFSADGMENLRFGKVVIEVDDLITSNYLSSAGSFGRGDGAGLAAYLSTRAEHAAITPYPESIPDKQIAEVHQSGTVLGSKAMFNEIRGEMEGKSDLLVYIHGFNVSWHEAVGSACALQEMLNGSKENSGGQNVLVVLFSWPSDGQALPFVSYKSDRSEAKGSSGAFGRGLLKLRDFLFEICKINRNPCGQNMHLLCHSMGNYLLQESLLRLDDFTPGNALTRIFDQIFLCAPDVDDNVLEPGMPMARLPELARCVTVYYNRQDKAMYVSDYTKGNTERLGCNGAARPGQLHNKIMQVDCTPVVQQEGIVEHDYYLVGVVNEDIRMSLDGVLPDDCRRKRINNDHYGNVYIMKNQSDDYSYTRTA